MINALITLTLAFGFILPIAGFIAYAHDSIVAKKKASEVLANCEDIGKTYRLPFTITPTPQTSNVINITPIRGLKAIASARNLTPITQQLFGKRYSLCNAKELRAALTYYA